MRIKPEALGRRPVGVAPDRLLQLPHRRLNSPGALRARGCIWAPGGVPAGKPEESVEQWRVVRHGDRWPEKAGAAVRALLEDRPDPGV